MDDEATLFMAGMRYTIAGQITTLTILNAVNEYRSATPYPHRVRTQRRQQALQLVQQAIDIQQLAITQLYQSAQ